MIFEPKGSDELKFVDEWQRIARGYKRQRELAVAKGDLSRLREYVDRRFDPTDDTPGIDCQLVCADTATNCEPCFASWKWKQTSFGAEFKGPQRICIIRSEEHTSELPSLMSISYAVFCLKKKN